MANQSSNSTLIISSGDISDVDGFFALAEYAKTGADVLFVMNYPAYINVCEEVASYEEENPGLGFKYGAKLVFDNAPKDAPKSYTDFLGKYDGVADDNLRMKSAMTDLAFHMAKNVWSEVGSDEKRGKLYFLIGGVNSINPFSAQAIKNEILVFSDSAPKDFIPLPPQADAIYDEGGRPCRDDFDLSQFSNIYLDFNGSMAFFSEDSWLVRSLMEESAQPKLRGAFIMGGVEAEKPPQTMPSIAGKLNRFSSATMNQLYHPCNTARFLAFLSERGVPSYVVTNNAVADLSTFSDAARTLRTYDGVDRFLRANALDGRVLSSLARAYYETPRGAPPPRKPFDFYTAAALRAHTERAALAAPPRRLFYSDAVGAALVSAAADWPAALAAYARGADTAPHPDDSDFIRAKKASFARELAAMAALPPLPSAPVLAVAFDDALAAAEGVIAPRRDRPARTAGPADAAAERPGKVARPAALGEVDRNTSPAAPTR